MRKFYFAQLYHEHNGNIQQACGSDGVVMLDGRLSKSNMKQLALDYLKRHQAFYIGKAVGFSLHVGNYSNNKCIQSFERF